MSSTNLVPTNLEQFLSYMQRNEPVGQSKPLPKYVRLDGKAGKYVIKNYDQSLKKSTNDLFLGTGNPFEGTILAIRYFCKSKHDPNSKIVKRTREFQFWENDPIELLEIDYGKSEENKKVVGTFPDYQAFKSEYSDTDKMTGKSKNYYDVFTSLYIYIPALQEVINYRFKGDTRSAWFDYLKNWRINNEVHISQVVTMFGVSEEKSMETGEKYKSGTFISARKNTIEEMSVIMQYVSELMRWMNSFSDIDVEHKENDSIDSKHVLNEPLNEQVGEEIDLSSIPF